MRRDGWGKGFAPCVKGNGGSDASVFVFDGFAMNMEANLVALVPGFKFERHPMFVLACDAFGLQWLRDGFLELASAEPGVSFVIGDGIPIASDDSCRLTVMNVRAGEASKILPSDQPDFIWYVDPGDAANFAAQLSALLSSNIPGHQYLEVEQGNYRSVVVTKQEYPVDTIRAMRDGRTRP